MAWRTQPFKRKEEKKELSLFWLRVPEYRRAMDACYKCLLSEKLAKAIALLFQIASLGATVYTTVANVSRAVLRSQRGVV